MKTKHITLFYTLTPTEVIPPSPDVIERKEKWIDQIQKTIEAEYKPLVMRVTYELWNPDIERIMRFFNGPVVKYWTIQNFELVDSMPEPDLIKRSRESILDEVLGYDVELVDRKVRRRKSTADLETTQKWTDLLERIKETVFDPSGYEMPDSEEFRENEGAYGHGQAERIALEGLQNRLRARLTSQ